MTTKLRNLLSGYKRGLEQGTETGKRWLPTTFDRVFTSPYVRTTATADTLLTFNYKPTITHERAE